MSDMYLIHHGILGQKWGVRRYQNPDGSYKKGAEGRYDPDSNSTEKSDKKKFQLSDKQKKALKVGMTVAGVAAVAGAAAYGSYAINKAVKEQAVSALVQYRKSSIDNYMKKAESAISELNEKRDTSIKNGTFDDAAKSRYWENYKRINDTANRKYDEITRQSAQDIKKSKSSFKDSLNAVKNAPSYYTDSEKHDLYSVGNVDLKGQRVRAKIPTQTAAANTSVKSNDTRTSVHKAIKTASNIPISNYSFEDLAKANSDLLKRSIDRLMK